MSADQAQNLQHVFQDDGSSIIRAHQIPWTRLGVPGVPGLDYKLLSLDDDRGSATLLMKIEPGIKVDAHKHLAAVEVYVISGSFFYENGQVNEGEYMFEAGGVTHAPATDTGLIAIGIIHGPLLIPSPDGGIAAVVDTDVLYECARQNNAASHIKRSARRR
jgi:quercetin dioxygenase-like cupin family protein